MAETNNDNEMDPTAPTDAIGMNATGYIMTVTGVSPSDDGEDATPETDSSSSKASRSSTLSSDDRRHASQVPNKVKAMSRDDNDADDVFIDELEDTGDDQDSDSLDSEFEAYVHAYRSRKKKRRKEKVKESIQPSKWSKVFQLVCVGLVVQLVTITCIVLIFKVLDKKDTTPSASASTNLSTPPTTTNLNHSYPPDLPHVEITVPHVEVEVLQPPPDNMQDLCNLHVETSSLEKCRRECNRALCCHISRDQPFSCWNDNLETCEAYSRACSVLGAPGNANAIGSDDNDQEDKHPSITTTVFPNAHVLWGLPNLLPPAPEQLAQVCQAAFVWSDNVLVAEETSDATLTCHEVCHAAQCCWDSTLTEPADRCWTHPNCGLYVEACRFLMKERDAEKPSTVIPQASADIAQYCDPNVMKNDLENLLTCQAACLPAESCWNEAVMDRSDSELCIGYNDACSILSVPLPTEPSTTIWSPLEQEPATVTSTSVSVTNSSALHETPPSAVYNPSTGSLPELYPAETIWDTCLNHDNTVNIRDGQQTLCQQACQAGKCCFEEDENGGDVIQNCPPYLPETFCEKYTPCETIFANNSDGRTEAKVRDACSNLQDLSDCVALCGEEQATCCFTNDPWKLCAISHPNTVCTDYAACEVLYGSAVETVTGRKNDPPRRRSLLRNERRAS